jgi:hypothetical protein
MASVTLVNTNDVSRKPSPLLGDKLKSIMDLSEAVYANWDISKSNFD